MRHDVRAAAFRASVDQRLRNHARAVGVPVMVIRRQAALERLMARLMIAAPDRWALKGGLALDTRLGERARASMDMDIDHVHGMPAAREDLLRAVAADLGDYFTFTLGEGREIKEDGVSLAIRYRVECAVANAPFEVLQVDVTVGPPEVWETVRARRPGLLAAVGLGPIDVLLVPLERQVAEKLHAYTRTYHGGEPSTRAKDLVDLVLIGAFETLDGERLRADIQRTFAARRTHEPPTWLPPPPAEWRTAYRKMAETVGITTDPEEAHRMVAVWLDPVLTGMQE